MSAADEVLAWHDGSQLTVSVTGANGEVVAQMTLEQAAVVLRYGGAIGWYYGDPERRRYAVLRAETGRVASGPGLFEADFIPDENPQPVL